MFLPLRLWPLLALHLVSADPAHAAAGTRWPFPIVAGRDLDEDGLTDEIEDELGTDFLEPDTDGDTWNDLVEFIHETDPLDPDDFPREETITFEGGLAGPSARLRIQELMAGHRLLGPPPAKPKPAAISEVRYYYLPGHMPDLAVEVRKSGLAAGSYLLLWRHILGWNPLQLTQRYSVAVRTADGRTLATWKNPVRVDESWTHVGLSFTLNPSDADQLLAFSVTPEAGDELRYMVTDFSVISAGIETDIDRDGRIIRDERPSAGRPLRHWINDDDDEGEYQTDGDMPGAKSPDHVSPGVDGLRDLVDFIPLNLHLAEVVRRLPPSQGFRYHLHHPHAAIQAVLTSLPTTGVGAIHRNPDLQVYGDELGQDVTAATVLRPGIDRRIELPRAFIERIRDRGHGVVLIEGVRPSWRDLEVEITQAERVVARLSLPLSLMPVERMYRHADLTAAAKDYAGRPASRAKLPRAHQITEPYGLPDAETPAGWVVMIHGYNVPADSARGWHAETFKRMRAMGSVARFVGLTWNGDTGLDYHKAVFHAFQTGDEIPKVLGFLDPKSTTLVAHSLGNVVASQAIQAGFTPAGYYMLNAALPIEAVAGDQASTEESLQMTETTWRPYSRKLFAAEWWRLFSPADRRSSYTWQDCFRRVRTSGIALNCYSPGEDVTNCPSDMTSASVLATLWSGRGIDYGAWKTQELLKGVGLARSLAAPAMERSQGGWGFNAAWRGRYVPHGPMPKDGGHYERMSPEAAAKIAEPQLRVYPFFRHFAEVWLHQPDTFRVSPLLSDRPLRYDLLARAIPAMTYAAGGAPIPSQGQAPVTNFDLERYGRKKEGRWPNRGHTDEKRAGRWLHSDFKNVALPFVHPLFHQLTLKPSR